MNLVLAVAFFAVWLMGFGVPTPQPVVSSVSACVIPMADEPRECLPTDRPTPAKNSLSAGDRIVTVNGRPISSWQDVSAMIRANGGKQVRLDLERDGVRRQVSVDLISTERANPDDPRRIETVGFLGVTPTRTNQTLGPGAVVDYLGTATERTVRTVLDLPTRMMAVWNAAFGDEEREKDGPIGVVGMGRLGGDIAQPNVAASDKIAGFFSVLGGINPARLRLDLLPLLPFDGGHAAGAVWEGLRNGFARLTRRPEPAPVDISKALPLTYAMAILLVCMSALLIYADLVNPVRLVG